MLNPGNRVVVEPSIVSFRRIRFCGHVSLCKDVTSTPFADSLPMHTFNRATAGHLMKASAPCNPGRCAAGTNGQAFSRVLKDQVSLRRRTQDPTIQPFRNIKREH